MHWTFECLMGWLPSRSAIDRTVIVCAGNRREFLEWCKANPPPPGSTRRRPRIIFASDWEAIAGLVADELIITGTFWRRSDAAVLHEYAMTRLQRRV